MLLTYVIHGVLGEAGKQFTIGTADVQSHPIPAGNIHKIAERA
jgi:hypothetical protein